MAAAGGADKEGGPSSRLPRQQTTSRDVSSVSESGPPLAAPPQAPPPAQPADGKRRRVPKVVFDNSVEPTRRVSRLGQRVESTQSLTKLSNAGQREEWHPLPDPK